MKCAMAVLLLLALGICPAAAARLQETPMAKVVVLIRELKARIETDGQAEQQSFDKYACWCEDTLGRKAKAISDAKEQIEQLENKMKELNGDIAAHGAEIQQLKSDIAANTESQREANEVRQKEFSDFNEEKTENEQCIGALEAAIKVLTGAGTKKGFLETMKEAQLLSVVAGVRGLLKHPTVSRTVTGQDMDVVQHFVSHPEDFVPGRATSAMQIANNPFGDYAPQSTQIQGILKGMYDAFVGDMEKANVEEAEQEKAHQELMATKQMELNTLQTTFDRQTVDKADKTEQLAQSTRLRDDTAEQLAADEAFFADTKEGCKVKAAEWSERTRLRTEELNGIGMAVQILSSPEATATFSNSTTTLVQVSARRSRGKVFEKLKALSQTAHSMTLARLAAQVKTGGHFDKVIISIDKMIALLRREEQSDIEHRDRCQNGLKKNVNDKEDLNHAIGKSNNTLTRMEEDAGKLQIKIGELEDAINVTKGDMALQLSMRNDESSDFKKAIKDDTDAIALLDRALVALTRFYKSNKIPLALIHRDDPEYSKDPDKAPETTWSGSNYGGRKSESEGIVAIIRMLKEDLQKEMQVARQEEADADAAYDKNTDASRKVLKSQKTSKLATEDQLAELQAKTSAETDFNEQKSADLAAEGELSDSLQRDCGWIETHFDTRRSKRKAEIEGLVQAKGYLAGVESGDELAP